MSWFNFMMAAVITLVLRATEPDSSSLGIDRCAETIVFALVFIALTLHDIERQLRQKQS